MDFVLLCTPFLKKHTSKFEYLLVRNKKKQVSRNHYSNPQMELLSEENIQFQNKLEFPSLTNPISRDIF